MAYLLERWLPPGLEGHHGNPEPYDLRQRGPADLPFEHEDVRVYVDNLFTDGLLTPTSGISRSALQGTWMAVGVAGTPTEGQAERLRKLLELHEAEEPDSSSDHHEWIAVRWAEIVAVRWAISDVLEARDVGRFDAAYVRVQDHFWHGWSLPTPHCTTSPFFRGL